jgi:hypothetical protein
MVAAVRGDRRTPSAGPLAGSPPCSSRLAAVPTFCRHNRFFADCPICAKGTVLDPDRQARRRPRPQAARPGKAGRRGKAASASGAAQVSRGPYASVGPYDGAEVLLERVPGGLRMAAWREGRIERVAPVVAAQDLPALLFEAAEKDLLSAGAIAQPAAPEPARASVERRAPRASEPGAYGASPGHTGELRDELRVERLDGERIRVARWIARPGRGWELQEAPVMLPPQRFARALAEAAGKGVLAAGGETLASEGPVR